MWSSAARGSCHRQLGALTCVVARVKMVSGHCDPFESVVVSLKVVGLDVELGFPNHNGAVSVEGAEQAIL